MAAEWYYVIYFISVVNAAFSQILLKKGAGRQYGSFLAEYLNPYVIGGYFMLGLSVLLTIVAYRGMTYLNGQVIEATGYIIVLLLSFFFFGERLTRRKLLGTACILSGIAVYYL